MTQRRQLGPERLAGARAAIRAVQHDDNRTRRASGQTVQARRRKPGYLIDHEVLPGADQPRARHHHGISDPGRQPNLTAHPVPGAGRSVGVIDQNSPAASAP
jgi:hypothetical protein